MTILSFDTSTRKLNLVLWQDGKLLYSFAAAEELEHSEVLLPVIKKTLTKHNLNVTDLEVIGVGIGPGSFTGLRVGVATAKGLALTNQIPLVPLSTLELWAYAFLEKTNYPVWVILNAYRKEIFAAAYAKKENNDLISIQEPILIPIETLFSLIKEPVLLVGNALPLYQEMITESLGEKIIAPASDRNRIDLLSLALLTKKKYLAAQYVKAQKISPYYIRQPHITSPKGKTFSLPYKELKKDL